MSGVVPRRVVGRRAFTRVAIAGSAAVLGLACGGAQSATEHTHGDGDGEAASEPVGTAEAAETPDAVEAVETTEAVETNERVEAEPGAAEAAVTSEAAEAVDRSETGSSHPYNLRPYRHPCVQQQEQLPDGRVRVVSICPPYGAPPAERLV